MALPLPPYNKEVTIDDKINELEYEVGMRKKHFPEWASGPNKRGKPETYAKRLAIAEAILADYKAIKAVIIASQGTQTTLF